MKLVVLYVTYSVVYFRFRIIHQLFQLSQLHAVILSTNFQQIEWRAS